MINNVTLKIWGREFVLPIEYDCYQGETVIDEQVNAIADFIKKEELIDKSKELVEQFCKKKLMADDTNEKKDNIYLTSSMLLIEPLGNP